MGSIYEKYESLLKFREEIAVLREKTEKAVATSNIWLAVIVKESSLDPHKESHMRFCVNQGKHHLELANMSLQGFEDEWGYSPPIQKSLMLLSVRLAVGDEEAAKPHYRDALSNSRSERTYLIESLKMAKNPFWSLQTSREKQFIHLLALLDKR